MNQKQLSYFVEVYCCCNIQAAADKLYMSHQGLSRIIRSLEDELGAQLFHRTNRGLEPTDFAITLFPHVKRLLDDYAAIQGVHTLTGREKAVVSVYALDGLFAFLGAEMLLDFRREYPNITLSILDCTDEYALESLTAGRCDLALVNGPIDNTRFSALPIFFARYCIRMRRDHPLASREKLKYEDFRGYKVIGKGRAYNCFRRNMDRHLLAKGIEVEVPMECSDEELLMQLVEMGVGVAATYDYTALSHCGENTVIRYLDEENAGHHIYLAERVNALPTKAAREFKAFLTERAAQCFAARE